MSITALQILKGKPGGAKRKSRKGSKASVRRRKRASAANLPDSISLVKKLATSYLKMYLALEEAWTKHTTITSRLLHRNDVIKKAILSVRAQSNTDGRCPPEVKYAFDKLGSSGPEAESLQKILTEMVCDFYKVSLFLLHYTFDRCGREGCRCAAISGRGRSRSWMRHTA